jgi:DUF1680 family protein
MNCGTINNKNMKQKLFFIISLAVVSTSATSAQEAFTKVSPKNESLEILPLNTVKPKGWLQHQIQENLNGFVGHLDVLVPDLIIEDDIYNANRLTKNSRAKDLGVLGGEGDWQSQLFWWNSETQSNWWDGYIRSAILNQDEKHLVKIKNYVQSILQSQDSDGYLGIYDKELRYNFNNENGELWAKASVLRGLLAWYDYTNDNAVLQAVIKAVQNTMKHYPINKSQPFYSKNPNVGGLSHGLTFTDVVEQLFHITKDTSYRDYALFLYQDFSSHLLNEDAQLPKLLQPELKLSGHGVHTYEHLRSVAAAYYASGNEEIKNGLENFETKIITTTSVSGGPVGDEWIGGKLADATTRGYEYCSLQELLHSYASLQAKTGNKKYADKIEHLFFNAAQGARHPKHSSIAYLKSDNSYEMTGGLNGDKSDAHQTRFRYSPVHKEAAVCCVPNAGRIATYYTQHMWLKENNTLIASLLGPSVLDTEINGKKITISQNTQYPFSNTIEFEVKAYKTPLELKIRKPEFVTQFNINVPYQVKDGYIIIARNWKKKEKIKLEFNPQVVIKTDNKGDYYFQYGALILAHPIEAIEKETKTYPIKGFADLEHTPKKLVIYEYQENEKITPLENLEFETYLFNTTTQTKEKVILKPMAHTILRQVTFKKQTK